MIYTWNIPLLNELYGIFWIDKDWFSSMWARELNHPHARPQVVSEVAQSFRIFTSVEIDFETYMLAMDCHGLKTTVHTMGCVFDSELFGPRITRASIRFILCSL